MDFDKKKKITKLTEYSKKKLRTETGHKTTQGIVDSARKLGVELSGDKKNQQTQAYEYFRNKYNKSLLEQRKKKAQAKRERKHKKIWVSVTITAEFNEGGSNPFTVELPLMFETTRKNKKMDLERQEEDAITSLYEKYANGKKDTTASYSVSPMSVITNPNAIGDEKQKMKDIIPLDGYGDQTWNKKNGTCVVDYLRHTYDNQDGFKNKKGKYLLSDEFFAKLHTYIKTNDIHGKHDVDAIKKLDVDEKYDGKTAVSIYDGSFTMEALYVWCQIVNIPHYGLNTNEHLITELKFTRDKSMKAGRGLKPMVYQYKNHHFNPTIDPKKVLSLSQLNKSGKNKVNSENIDKRCLSKDLKKEVENKTDYEMEYLPDMMNQLPYIIETYGRDLQNKNIRLKENEHGSMILSSIVIEDKNKRISNVDKDMELYRDFCKRYEDMEFDSKSFSTMGLELLGDIDKSTMNPKTYDFFNARGVCNRTHHGFVGNNTTIENTQCFDINKHYSNCLSRPSGDFGLISFKDDFVEYDHSDIVIGYYYVETYDMTLLHGSNIYSHTIVKYALEENIITKDDIKLMLHSNTSIPKDRFQDFVSDTYDTYGRQIGKKIINRTIGCFNSTEKTVFKRVGFTNSVDELLSRINIHKRPFCKEFEVNDQKYYLYGSRETVVSSTNSRPLWISILDEGNIKLYQTAKSIGGEVIFRKTDALVIRNPKNIKVSDKMGGYDMEDPPNTRYSNGKLIVEEVRHSAYPTHALKVLKYKTSNEIDEIVEFCRNNSLLISGRAGTGKTFVAKRLIKEFNIRVKLAFTNKACININGSTIDNFLKLNDEKKICSYWAGNLQAKYVIVDEISMLNARYWSLLCDLKRMTGARFILLGDYRQCQAIEDDDKFNKGTVREFQYQSAMHYLCDYNTVEFNEYNPMARYDKDLWDVSEDVFNGRLTSSKPLHVKYDETMLMDGKSPDSIFDGTNICYLNKTRKAINQIVNEKMKTTDAVFIPANDDDYTQDAYVYEGLPVILHKTIKVDGDKLFSKNQSAIITNIENGMITINNSFVFPVKDFHVHCLLGYASTVHKSQGDTCVGKVNIYDWDKMDGNIRYTAITRATSLNDIRIVRGFTSKFKEASGLIYKITCEKTSKVYIGSTRDFEKRKEQHLSSKNDCMSKHLINPTFKIVKEYESISDKELLKLEQRMIDSEPNAINKNTACKKE